jgi:2-polyprenyl-6-methoxyphenol hydroxylase-like FAD-dependent oxidoreductase
VIDVAVIGAGPVGTLVAAELARRGVHAEVLEQRAEPGEGSRAVGVHAAALSALEASGATERLLAAAVRVREGEARRRGRTLGTVRFDRLHSRHPYVATLPQHRTEAALRETAAEWGASPARLGIAVEAVRTVDGHAELSLAGGERMPARIAVVAGGVRSRRLTPVAARVRRYPDRYLMTDCRDASGDGDRAVVHLDPAGVLESFPLPDGMRRYVAWMPPDGAEEGTAATERLRAAVAGRTGSSDAAAEVSAATAFGVGRAHPSAMRAGAVVAIGDAAHEVSPIGGQGMNLGLLDAVTLAPLLARWVRESEPPAEIDRWERRRRRAAALSARIAAVNTALGRPAAPAGAALVRAALRTPVEGILARAYGMDFDPAARAFSSPRR